MRKAVCKKMYSENIFFRIFALAVDGVWQNHVAKSCGKKMKILPGAYVYLWIFRSVFLRDLAIGRT